MSTQHYRMVHVTGIHGGEDSPIFRAYEVARDLFDAIGESDLVPSVDWKEYGHNFVKSFVVHPTGGSYGREAWLAHTKAVEELIEFLRCDRKFDELDWFVATFDTSVDDGFFITSSSEKSQ